MYIIDRIENNIAVLEDMETKKISYIDIDYLPDEIEDGTILQLKNGKYIINKELEQNRRKTIQDKFNKLIK